MIISHKHKFIFIKPQKTAGTSIELLLSRICGDDDIITPLGFDPDPNVREVNNARAPQNYKRPKPLKYWEVRDIYWLLRRGKMPHANYWEHLPADDIRKYAGDEVWNSYKKISVVRNPWDHAVSTYQWVSKYGYRGGKGTFIDFLKENYYNMWPYYSIKGLYDIDFMIRFESLEADIRKLGELLPIELSEGIPVTKNKNREDKSYNQFYDQEAAEIVRLRNLNLLEKFNYNF